MEGTLATMTMFGSNFAPRGWGYCAGQLLSISNNTALFSLLGTIYGGDGRTTFALPDLRGRLATGIGQGPGLSDRRWGERWGTEQHTMLITEMPVHNHAITHIGSTPSAIVKASSTAAGSADPAGQYWAAGTPSERGSSNTTLTYGASADTVMATDAVQINTAGLITTNSGGSIPFNISQPSLAVSMVICMQGVFPSRS